MSNFIVIGTLGKDTAVQNAVFGDIYEGKIPNAKYIHTERPTGFQGRLFRLFHHEKIRRFVPVRLRMLWEINDRRLKPLLSETEDNYIIFCPSTLPMDRVSPMLLRTLRKNRPECKLILYFVDGVERTAKVSGVSLERLLNFFKHFDAVYTYDHADSKKYNLPFLEVPVWISEEKPSDHSACELYFSGRDKGRSELLLNVYDRAVAAGLRCNYRIVNPSAQYEREGVHIAAWTPYKATVSEAIQSDCILEVLAANNYGATLRYKEAVIYNKKLLTNNPDIVHLPYYDARWMRYFESAEDIDLEWLGRKENVDYGYRGEFSAEYFLNALEEMYKRNVK